MSISKCMNCGKDFLTEADTFVFQHRNDGDYYSCGCKEFAKPLTAERLGDAHRKLVAGGWDPKVHGFFTKMEEELNNKTEPKLIPNDEWLIREEKRRKAKIG